MHEIRTLVATAWRLERGRAIAQLGLLLVGGVIGGAGLLLLVPIVNSVATTATTVQVPVLGDIDLGSTPLWALLAGFVALIAMQSLITHLAAVNTARLQQRIVDTLRHEAFSAVLQARWSFVTGQRRSDIIHTVTTGSARSGTAVTLLMNAAVSAAMALATAVIALLVAPGVAALAIAGVVVLSVVQGLGIRPARRLGRLSNERTRDVQAVVVDSLDSLRLVRAHDASGVWIDRLAAAFTTARDVQLAAVERQSAVGAIANVAAAAAAALLVLVATWADVEPAAIIVMVVLIGRLSRQATTVVRTALQLANALPAVSEVTELTAAARAAAEVAVTGSPAAASGTAAAVGAADATGAAGAARTPGGARLEVPTGAPLIELRDVTYRYPGTGPDTATGTDTGTATGRGVHHLDLTVTAGAITVITGPSGAGKSTVADLVLGLLTAQSGEVLVAGRALTEADLAWWRAHVAYVPQETVLIPGTLRDNLVWSVPGGADDDACRDALRRAAADFTDRLPDGLGTELGDRGVRLSGGERQRVAIARALLRRPALLVLDEATSSLDDATEAAVIDTVRSLTPAVSVLVIAHRQTTIAAADHVVHLVDGRRVG